MKYNVSEMLPIIMAEVSTTKEGVEALRVSIINALNAHDLDPLDRYALARTLAEAFKQASDSLTDDAMQFALNATDEDGRYLHPDACNGKEFVHHGMPFRVQIRNEYDYGNQVLLSADGTRRADPNSTLWTAKQHLIDERKEKNKAETKALHGLEAQLLLDHPRMQPIRTELVLSMRMREK